MGGYIKFILISCSCFYSFCNMFPCLCVGRSFHFSTWGKGSDLLGAHMTCSKSSPTSLLGECECVCNGGWGAAVEKKKGGQLCWKLSLPCAFAPFIHGSKRCVCVHVSVNESEYPCVFAGNWAHFRALGIERQKSSSSLPVLHIYSIGGEEKPRCVPSAATINSLETSPSPADFKQP